jgi:hypothetical protein
MCKGHGVIACRNTGWTPQTEEQKLKSARETEQKRAWLLAATPEQINRLEWKQIHSARMFMNACIINGDTEMRKVEQAVNAAFNRHVEEFDKKK